MAGNALPNKLSIFSIHKIYIIYIRCVSSFNMAIIFSNNYRFYLILILYRFLNLRKSDRTIISLKSILKKVNKQHIAASRSSTRFSFWMFPFVANWLFLNWFLRNNNSIAFPWFYKKYTGPKLDKIHHVGVKIWQYRS